MNESRKSDQMWISPLERYYIMNNIKNTYRNPVSSWRVRFVLLVGRYQALQYTASTLQKIGLTPVQTALFVFLKDKNIDLWISTIFSFRRVSSGKVQWGLECLGANQEVSHVSVCRWTFQKRVRIKFKSWVPDFNIVEPSDNTSMSMTAPVGTVSV